MIKLPGPSGGSKRNAATARSIDDKKNLDNGEDAMIFPINAEIVHLC